MKTSLPERSEHVAERLAAITEVIRELVDDDLAMLILFGSYARGDWVNDRYTEDGVIYTYESDFDLLVVTEGRATVERETGLSNAISRRLRRESFDRPSASIVVEDIEHLNKDLKRGNYFYCDIKEELSCRLLHGLSQGDGGARAVFRVAQECVHRRPIQTRLRDYAIT